MRLLVLLLGGLSLVFAGLLAVEVLQNPGVDGADPTGVLVAGRVGVPKAAPAAAAAPVLHGEEWAATILARPLFTRDRRPAGAASAQTAADSGGALPRLTGIAISPQRRRAIFAGSGDASKPVVVEEGDSIGGFVVRAIAPDGVTVQGPEGERTVALMFDPSPPAARADAEPAQPPPGYPQPGYPQPGYPQQVPPGQVPQFGMGRPGPQLDPTLPQMPRPPFNRPRADLDAGTPVAWRRP